MITDLVFSLPALFFLLFLPGYALISALFPKKPLDWPERILSSLLLSITLNILTTIILNSVLNVPIKLTVLITQNAVFIILFTAIYLLRLKRLPGIYLELYEYNLEKFMKTPTAIILVISTVLLTYSIHQTYQYPYLASEWQQISLGKQIMDDAVISSQNPLGIGFHILLAQIYMITGQIPATYSTYLPAILAGIGALGAYALTKKATGNAHIGLLAILFFAGIKSNMIVGGPWFLLASAPGMAYIFGILYFIASAFEEKNKTKAIIAFFLLMGLISTGTLALNLFNGFVPPAATPITYPIMLYGVAPFILALIGAYVCTGKKGIKSILPTWAGLMLLLIILFQASRVSVLMPYETALLIFTLSLVPLSAQGLYAILEIINTKLKSNVIATTASLIIISLAAYLIFSTYYDGAKTFSHAMDERTYKSIKWLSTTKADGGVILTRSELSAIIPSIAGSNMTPLGPDAAEDNRNFFMAECDGKRDILAKYNVSFVLVSAEDKTDCEFLPWIYTQKGIYIYEVDKTLT